METIQSLISDSAELWTLEVSIDVKTINYNSVVTSLVSAVVLSRLEYCNAVLGGLPAATLAPLHGAAIRRPCVLCRCTPCVESVADRTETHAVIDNNIQASYKDILFNSAHSSH